MTLTIVKFPTLPCIFLLCLYALLAYVVTDSQILDLDCAPGVACIDRHAAVLPLPFNRTDGGAASLYGDTNAINVPGFDKLKYYNFLSFDDCFLSLLGRNATYKFFFEVKNITHEGPVWSPEKKWVVFTEIEQFWQYRLDLSGKEPTLCKFNASPPIWSPAGGSYHKGLVYFTCPGGGGQKASLVTYNPHTNEAKTILNNYCGVAFNSPDDLIIDPNGNIWWTDPWFGYLGDFNPAVPELTPGVWFFNTTSGSSKLLDGTLLEPNGIVSSLDWSTIYVSDTGLNSEKPLTFHPTGPRTLYSYKPDPSTGTVSDKRTFSLNDQRDPDGLKVDTKGNLWTASGKGVDVLDPEGNLLGKVQTNFTVTNLVFTGEGLEDLWLFGLGGVARVLLQQPGKPILRRNYMG